MARITRIEARLQKLPVEPRRLSDYAGIAPAEQVERARAVGRDLAGIRVLFISTAPPEPSDASRAIAALLLGLGVEADRALLSGDSAFAAAGRDLADGLAGADAALGDIRWQEMREAGEAAAVSFDTRGYDVVISHGPAAMTLIEGRRDDRAAWVWRTGRDLSCAGDAVEPLGPVLGAYSELSFGLPAFVPAGIDDDRVSLFSAAFDPLARAQRDPAAGDIAGLIDGTGTDLSRPVVSQIGRLDAAADPLAAIEAWRLAREEVPGLQLAIAGRIETSDPEAVTVLEEARSFAGTEEDLILATDRSGATPEQIGAIGRVSRCALPASLSDELDPEVSAALWRGTPVLAEGEGARSQVRDGVDGHHVDGVEERATRLIALASDPRRGTAMGRNGRLQATESATVVRLLGEELQLLGALPGRSPAPREKVHA